VFVKKEINFKIYLGSNSCGSPYLFFPRTVKAILLMGCEAHLPISPTRKVPELYLYHKLLIGLVAGALWTRGQVRGSNPLGPFFLKYSCYLCGTHWPVVGRDPPAGGHMAGPTFRSVEAGLAGRWTWRDLLAGGHGGTHMSIGWDCRTYMSVYGTHMSVDAT
jgi:hypothetical protein